MENPKLESIEFKINIHFVINLNSFTQFHIIHILFFTLGFKQKQFIYSSIENFDKPVLKDDTQNTTKVVVTLSLVFLYQSCYVKKLSILVQQRSSVNGYLWRFSDHTCDSFGD